MKIIKSFRKTLSLTIDKTWELIIKAPFFVSKKTIENFVLKNKNWVDDQKFKILEKVKSFKQWDKFYYFWEEYSIIFSWDYKQIYFDWMNFYLSREFKKDLKDLLEKFYKLEAKKYIKNRLDFIAWKYNLEYNNLKITSAKTRWGSCTSSKNINFSYRLIMAPIRTIDYVIAHELAHLKYMNHSKMFRWEVEFMMKWILPWDYKIAKEWLKKFWNELIF